MSRSIHFISRGIPGYGPPDGNRLSCSGTSGKSLGLSPRSCREHKLFSDVKFLPLRCVSRYTSSVCNASSSSYRRNPDFSKQSRQGYSRHKNRHNDTREEYEELEESETLSSKNGPLLSVSGNQKYQATATTGPREKEIVELFRKVQTQLREKAAMKEGKKIEDSQPKSKESETVDSLLKLLRKHSVQQGKKSNTNANNKDDFILDQEEQNGPVTQEKTTSISDSTSSVKDEIMLESPRPQLSRKDETKQESPRPQLSRNDETTQESPRPQLSRNDETTQESPRPQLSRPKSSFRKRSPVPEIKFQPIYTDDSGSSISDSGKKWISTEAEADDDIQDVEYDSESDEDPLISETNAFDEILEDKVSEVDETEHEGLVLAKEEDVVQTNNLPGMKLTELRALAKARGMKGFSKLKKNDLIELLSS